MHSVVQALADFRLGIRRDVEQLPADADRPFAAVRRCEPQPGRKRVRGALRRRFVRRADAQVAQAGAGEQRAYGARVVGGGAAGRREHVHEARGRVHLGTDVAPERIQL